MADFKKFGGGFRDKRGGGHFDRPGEGRTGGFGGGRPPFKKFGDRGGFGGPKRFGGKPSFGGRGGFGGGRDGGDREMFDTTCADCGKPCQVPFRPNGEKPVFCNDCFASKRDSEGGEPRRFERRDDRREDRGGAERPQAPREVKQDGRIDELAGQVKALHAKLDALIMMIETHTHGTHTAAATPVKEASAPVVASEDKKLAKNAKTKKVEAVIAERKAKKVTKKK